ncbi:MAG: YceI family protein [Ktedonobacterales bacterium]|nr:YceI family protein [Ktedonobacterales bacterium]
MIWTIDTAHTQIEFSVKHMMIATAKGRFNRFSGTLDLDARNPANTSVNVTIEAASVDTNNDMRDNHLRSPDFFDVARYPTITYVSRKVEPRGQDRYQVLGDLTLHGVTREVPLEVTVEGPIKDIRGSQRAAFSIRGEINRKDYGLTYNATLETGGVVVSEKVNLVIEAQAVEAVTEAASV